MYRRGGWWARVTFTDPITGKHRDLQRKARTRAEAADIRDQLLREIDQTGGRSLAFERATFEQLAEWYEKTYLVPPHYVDGRRVAGLRSWKTQAGWLRVLRAHFAKQLLRAITYEDLRRFKAVRLATPVARDGSQRAIATVHRELVLLRRMLNVAKREGWILRNAFEAGDALISVADEKQRQRIVTTDEEARLLAACERPRYRHLRPIIICALDTGMRRGEILTLSWRDVDLELKTIKIRAFNTKTMRERSVSMTSRLYRELLKLAERGGEPDGRVFGIAYTPKNGFETVRKRAGLPDVRFHDLRHTAATRLVRGGLSLAEAGRILGHTVPTTTYRYVNADVSTAERAATILDAFALEPAAALDVN